MSGNKVLNMESPSPMMNSNIFEDSSPYMITVEGRRGQREEAKEDTIKSVSVEVMSSHTEWQEDNSRKEQHIIIYFLNLITTFCISFQNIILVFTSNEISKAEMSIAISTATVLISIFTTYRLCRNKWKIFNLYILLDNIFLTEVASCFGFVGFLLVLYQGYWYEFITMIAFPVEILFMVGNFRIMMSLVKWSKWRVILFKLVLLADSAVFFEIGAYYMSEDFKYTGGEDSELDGKIKDFVLLYIFGLFALFVELYTKLSEIDQTA